MKGSILLQEDFCNFIYVFSRGPLFEQTWTPIIQGCFVFGWNWPSGSGEEDETVKSLLQRQQRQRRQQRRRTTDIFWSEKLRWANNTIRIVSNSPTNDPCKKGENKTGTNPCMKYVVWSLRYAIIIFSWNNKCYLCSVLACAFAKFQERTRVETAPIIFV